MKKTVFLLSLYILFFLSFSDGVAYKLSERNIFEELRQDSQNAVIFHKDDTQKMFISINTSIEDIDKMLWIFPIKAEESKVKIEVVDKFPFFSGKKVKEEHEAFDFSKVRIDSLFEIYKFLDLNLDIPFFRMLLASQLGTMGASGKSDMTPSYIKPYSTKQKDGIRLLHKTILSEQEFRDFVKFTSKEFDEKNIKAFKPYLNKDYALIFYFIEDLNKFREKFERKDYSPAIYAEFPQKTVFYPMQATMEYKREFPVNIIISGDAYFKDENNIFELESEEEKYKTKNLRFFYRTYKIWNISENIPEKYFTLFSFKKWKKEVKTDFFFDISRNYSRYEKQEKFQRSRNSSTKIVNTWQFRLAGVLIYMIVSYICHLMTLMILDKKFIKYWKDGYYILFTTVGMIYIYEKIKCASAGKKMNIYVNFFYRFIIYLVVLNFIYLYFYPVSGYFSPYEGFYSIIFSPVSVIVGGLKIFHFFTNKFYRLYLFLKLVSIIIISPIIIVLVEAIFFS